MDGYLLIDKPAGWTSFDVVAKIRGMLRAKTGEKVKVGHSGTLDPFATGLLIILIGKYTKRQDEFMKLDKVYEATLELGKTSTTGDPEGKIVESTESRVPSIEEVQATLKRFTGEIEQTPPIYSAIKIGGKKAYELARAGKPVELKSRKVTVYSYENVEYDYPTLKFTVKVSSGTYIRSLAADIGEDLGCAAYLTGLNRQSIDSYQLKDAASLDSLTENSIAKLLTK